jgi:hypothetical protein
MAGIIKMNAMREKAASASGAYGINLIVSYVGELAEHSAILAQLVTTPRLEPYAISQLGEDISAQYLVMRDAIISTKNAIVNGLPKDAQGNIQQFKLDAEGRQQVNTLAPNDPLSVGYRNVLDTLLSTIN